MSKKNFVAPQLNEESDLATLTLGNGQISGGLTCGPQCDQI